MFLLFNFSLEYSNLARKGHSSRAMSEFFDIFDIIFNHHYARAKNYVEKIFAKYLENEPSLPNCLIKSRVYIYIYIKI